MNLSIERKYKSLQECLLGFGRVLVAFSGGVDSTFLLKVCVDSLGKENVLAVTAKSETYPEREFAEAKKLASSIGSEWKAVSSSELGIPGFAENPENRCYYCKKELFSILGKIAKDDGYCVVLDGSTASDLRDHRPGADSAKELCVKSPIQEVGLEKEEIRELSKSMGLPTWNKGSFACLASRFPYGEKITAEKLDMVGKAESLLFDFGFKQLRVRHHEGDIARIEMLPEDFERIMGCREEIVKKMRDIGYLYISLDMEGYKTGSMNKALKTAGNAV